MRILLTLGVLSTIIGSTYGLHCYQCIYWEGIPDPSKGKAENDRDCELKPLNVVNCTQTRLFKTVRERKLMHLPENTMKQGDWVQVCGKHEVAGGDGKMIERYCGAVSGNLNKDTCSKEDKFFGVKQRECVCPNDKCNSAPFEKPSIITIFISVLFVKSFLL